MDKIIIKDLEIYANHGVFKEEKSLGQKFIISMELYLDMREAGNSDDLTKSVHYGIVCNEVDRFFKENTYDLIERAAEETCKFILTTFKEIKKVKLKLKKPWAPIGKPLDYAAVEIERQWHRVFISAGSNLGDKMANIKKAIDLLNVNDDILVEKISKFYNTEPWGYEEQEEFLNCAFELKTLLYPKELMDLLLDIEKELKRERIIKWGPRTLDLDIIFYDDMISDNENVILPHPRMHQRQFVLKPLSDIAPYYVHPILKEYIIDLSLKLPELK